MYIYYFVLFTTHGTKCEGANGWLGIVCDQTKWNVVELICVLFPGPRTCSVRPCVPLSSCSMWCRRPWRPTTSSFPTLRETRPTLRAALAQTLWPAAPPPALTTPPRGWAGTDRKTTIIHTRLSTWIRRTATRHWHTRLSRPPSHRRDTATRLRGQWPPPQRQALPRRSGGGWISS